MAKGKSVQKVLTKADFQKRKVEFLELPDLGGGVWVKALSGKSMLIYNDRIKSLGKDTEITFDISLSLMALMISLTVLDAPDGTLMFTEEEANALADGDIGNMMAMTEKAMTISGIDASAISEVKSKLKNAKNSSSTVA